MPNQQEITTYFKSLQNQICNFLQTEDGKSNFEEDVWAREEGGGGITRIIQNGAVIEKGGVNFSAVSGELDSKIVQKLKINQSQFFATGVSIVIHPASPLVPIIHMNVRYFEMADGTYWFGGGIDLTPIYVDDELAKDFHTQLKNACNKHSVVYYNKFKKWADDYFFIKHRNETRGIGGVFFDRLTENTDFTKQQIFEFVQEIGNAFIPIYKKQLQSTKNLPFKPEHKQWQLIRRGRYVEFNLVYDKGTKFGLDTNGRIESILMSLPKEVNWFYNHTPEEGSPEKNTLNKLIKGIDWV